MKTTVERRRFRRAELDVPVTIRPIGPPEEPEPEPLIGEAKNVSLAGVLCHVQAPCALTPGQSVMCTVEIPEELVKRFPFARLTGRGSVVRLEPVPAGRRAEDNRSEKQLIGLAIAFASDVTALGAMEWW